MIGTYVLSDSPLIKTYDLGDLRQITRNRGRLRGFSRKLRVSDFKHYGYLDTAAYVAGSASTWTSTGGSGIGGTITCTSLASGSARVGAKSSSLLVAPPNGTAAVLPDYLLFVLQLQFGTAPTAGGAVGLYLSFSNSATAGTNNAGFNAGGGGADGNLGNVDQLPQMLYAGALIASYSLGTGVQQAYLGPVSPLDQYFSPVIYNTSSTGESLDSTASHTVLTMIPYWRQRAA